MAQRAVDRTEEADPRIRLRAEIGQSFLLMGLMALAVSATLGLSLLAARVLG